MNEQADDATTPVVDDAAQSDELPLTPQRMAMMTIAMFVGFVAFVAVCLPLFFFD